MAFTYPPTGSSSTSGNDKTINLITGAPAGYYSPKGDTNYNTNYWDRQNVTMIPFIFNKNFSFTDWGVVARDWSSAAAGFVTNGGKIECALYNSDANTYAPTTLNTALGVINVPGTDPAPGGSPIYLLNKTLAAPLTLTANLVYWVAVRTAINDGSGGYVSGEALNIQALRNSGVGVMQSHPIDAQSWGYNGGSRGAISDGANSFSVSVGSWVASHAGLAPFIALNDADMVYVTQGYAVHLKGVVA